MVALEAKCLEEERSNNKGGNENSEMSCGVLGLLSTPTVLAESRSSTVMQLVHTLNGGKLRPRCLE